MIFATLPDFIDRQATSDTASATGMQRHDRLRLPQTLSTRPTGGQYLLLRRIAPGWEGVGAIRWVGEWAFGRVRGVLERVVVPGPEADFDLPDFLADGDHRGD